MAVESTIERSPEHAQEVFEATLRSAIEEYGEGERAREGGDRVSGDDERLSSTRAVRPPAREHLHERGRGLGDTIVPRAAIGRTGARGLHVASFAEPDAQICELGVLGFEIGETLFKRRLVEIGRAHV